MLLFVPSALLVFPNQHCSSQYQVENMYDPHHARERTQEAAKAAKRARESVLYPSALVPRL